MENGAGSEDDENIYEDIGVLQDRALDTARPIRRTSAVRTPPLRRLSSIFGRADSDRERTAVRGPRWERPSLVVRQ